MANGRHATLLIALLAAGWFLGCESASPTSPTPPAAILTPQTPRTPATFPPGTLSEVTLSGVVYEVTPAGRVPIPDVAVYCELCGVETHSWANTDSNGVYRFFGIWLDGFPTRLSITEDGFADPPGLSQPWGPGWREVRIDGDTRFDIELVRR